MKLDANQPHLIRSQSEPVRGKATEHVKTKRSLSVSFAPPPVDDAFRRRAFAGSVHLPVASISAVTRHLAALAISHQNAPSNQRGAAKRELIRLGSNMFADYIARHAETDPEDVWALKALSIASRGAHEAPETRGSSLEALRELRCKLSERESQVLDHAEIRRGILLCDFRAAHNNFFMANGVEYTPAMQGILVGCMLEGASVAIEGANAAAKPAVLGTVVALCNAMEHSFTKPEPDGVLALVLSWLLDQDDDIETCAFWQNALNEGSKEVLEKCADKIVSQPDIFGTSRAKAEFAAAVREVCAFPIGRGADHELADRLKVRAKNDYELHGPVAFIGG